MTAVSVSLSGPRSVHLHRLRTVAKAVAGRLLTILIASFVVFMALSAAPGNPVRLVLGPKASPAARAQLEHRLGLDQPILERYWNWLTGVLHGDFGISLVYKTAVGPLIGARLGTTLLLVAYAAVLILIAGLGIGVLGGAFRRAGAPVAGLTGFLLGVPSFVAAQLLILFFALDLGWFPAQGAGSGFSDQLYHLTLPAISLAIAFSAWVAQVTMTSVREERIHEHVDTARGRGMAAPLVFRRHVLRNAAVPMITVSGLTVASLFAGAVVAERAFNIGGLGSLMLEAVSGKDYNIVLAVTLILITVFVIATSVIDIVQYLLDPRLSKGGGR